MLAKNRPVFQLKGSVFTLTILQLLSENLDGFSGEMQALIEKNPGFFQHIPDQADFLETYHLCQGSSQEM